jgi:hypothetical protein
MSYNTFTPIVTDGLILSLDAANTKSYSGTGTSWLDLSKNGNSTLFSSPTFVNTNGGNFNFNGVNQYASGSGITITNNVTLLVWFKTNTAQTNKYILSMPGISTGENGIDINFIDSTTSSIGAVLVNLANNSRLLTYTTTYNDGNWHMTTVTYNGSNATFYYDGISRDTKALTGNLKQTVNGEYNIARFGSFGAFGNVNISLTLIYNRALSSSEVLQNYNATKWRFI